MRKAIVLGASVLAAASAAAVVAARRLNSVADWPEAPGRFTTVGSESIHHLSNSEGNGPTIVFESALSCPCTEWAWVIRELDGRLPYLAYDRPGNGWSTQHAPPRTAAEHAATLRELLSNAGLPGPYVLVGHSVGGLLARTFALHHADDVAGIVLVDSSHPDQLERSALQREGMSLVEQGIWATYWRARFGLSRPDDGFGAIGELPEHLVEPSRKVMHRPEPWAAARREFADWYTFWANEAREAVPRADVPVAVVTAGAQSSMDLAHARMQAELAQLTDVGSHDVVYAAEHDALVMRRELASRVVKAVEWAVENRVAAQQPVTGRKS